MWFRSVRVRLTAIVALVSALVAVLAATLGVDRVEQSLLDDEMDEAAAEQAGFLEFVVVESGLFESGVIDEPFVESEIEFIGATLAELEELGELDALFAAARLSLDEELPVLTNLGLVAMVGRDGVVSLSAIDPRRLGRPAVTQYTIDLIVSALLDPTVEEIIGIDPDVLLPEVFERPDEVDLAGVALRYERRSIAGVEFVVAGDVTDVVRSVDRIQGVLWIAGPLLVAAAAIVTWLLTGRALRPVQQMTERVDRISAGSLHERVPEPGTGDEIAGLAVTMNRMLDRLEVDDRRLRRFVSDASHELRSPVAVLRSEAEVALRRRAEDLPEREARRFAEGVLEESGRLQRIVEDLLVLARGEERQGTVAVGVLDLDDIVLEEAGRRRRVTVETRGVSAGRVRGTAEAAARVVAHLLDNAARHASASVAIGLETVDDMVTLTVDDDGPGIPEVDRARVFERFTRLEAARTRDGGGAGLGWAVVAETVRALGGTVEIDDSSLGGACFRVRVPSAAAEGGERAE